MPKIAIILGSSRTPANGPGFASWLTHILTKRFSNPENPGHPFDIVTVDPCSPPHPLGPPIDGTRLPAQIRDPALYSSPSVREWSAFVSSCDAFIILTPQYNWGVPGELKNSLDHLYSEWRDKPVMLVTYGGHGGSKCAAHLREILGGALSMRVLDHAIQISLPREYITGDQRVPVDGPIPDFLKDYESLAQEAADEMKQVLVDKSVPS